MEKFNLGYSVKNIPTPTERQYKLQLMDKIKAVIKRMRWKAIFFNEKDDESNKKTSKSKYGLKSNICPPPVKDLTKFEEELFELVNKLKFRRANCQFQQKLKTDIRIIQSSEKTLTPADKTSNMYKMKASPYEARDRARGPPHAPRNVDGSDIPRALN